MHRCPAWPSQLDGTNASRLSVYSRTRHVPRCEIGDAIVRVPQRFDRIRSMPLPEEESRCPRDHLRSQVAGTHATRTSRCAAGHPSGGSTYSRARAPTVPLGKGKQSDRPGVCVRDGLRTRFPTRKRSYTSADRLVPFRYADLLDARVNRERHSRQSDLEANRRPSDARLCASKRHRTEFKTFDLTYIFFFILFLFSCPRRFMQALVFDPFDSFPQTRTWDSQSTKTGSQKHDARASIGFRAFRAARIQTPTSQRVY